jgi:hypothetical protein
LRKAYNANEIIKTLEKLHPDFYPKPSRQSKEKDAFGVWRLQPITSGYLTKQDLIRLYAECGDKLHRGAIPKIFAASDPVPNLARPKDWANKIWTLLEHHQIQTIDPNIQLIAQMKDKAESKPQFSYWKRRPDGLWGFDGAVRAAAS